MTRTTNARVAGVTFLLYIAVGVTSMLVARGLPDAEGTAARLAVMAQHASVVRINMLLGLTTGFIALTLGVALYGITRDEDHEIALLALLCRVGEGLSIFFPMFATLGLLWLASDAAAHTAGSDVLAGFLMKVKTWNVTLSAIFFAVGSSLFCWLLLRGRMIPPALAWLGVIGSVLLVAGLPLQLAAVLDRRAAMLMWIPIAVFEITVALWFLIRGVAPLRKLQADSVGLE
jgi:hypothetical protein